MTTAHPSEEDLAALADGQLSGDAELAARRHIESCPRCCGVLQGHRRLDGLLAALPVHQPGREVLDRVRRQVLPRTPAEAILTLEEVAALLRLDEEAMALIVDDLPAFELAGRIRVRRDRLDEWIDARQRQYADRAAAAATLRCLRHNGKGVA